MARKELVVIHDDIDDAPDAQERVFLYLGKTYAIDLAGKNLQEFDEAMSYWAQHGRRVSSAPRTRTNGSSDDVGAVREWARENGYAVSDRGRIPAEIREAYEANAN